MNKRTKKNVQPEQELNNEPKADKMQVSPAIGNALVGSSFSFEDFLNVIIEKDPGAKYSIQYADYEDNQWTCESLLMAHRAASVSNDASIRKIFLKLSNGTCLVVAP